MSDYFYPFHFLVEGATYALPYGWGAGLDILDAIADEENQ